MAREFVGCQRGQMLLMPPSLSEWLPEDHLVWTVLGAVEQMDLERFREAYRLGAAGRAPYDPAMMVALLLYSYARGNRSSRGIERACLGGRGLQGDRGHADPGSLHDRGVSPSARG
jgi:transposase